MSGCRGFELRSDEGVRSLVSSLFGSGCRVQMLSGLLYLKMRWSDSVGIFWGRAERLRWPATKVLDEGGGGTT